MAENSLIGRRKNGVKVYKVDILSHGITWRFMVNLTGDPHYASILFECFCFHKIRKNLFKKMQPFESHQFTSFWQVTVCPKTRSLKKTVKTWGLLSLLKQDYQHQKELRPCLYSSPWLCQVLQTIIKSITNTFSFDFSLCLKLSDVRKGIVSDEETLKNNFVYSTGNNNQFSCSSC